METYDYNGTGNWTLEAIRKRYRDHAKRLGAPETQELAPQELSKGNKHWVYPVMDVVIERIDAGDKACIELGIEFIENGPKQPFGRILHSNTARALRRAELTSAQMGRLRTTILRMLAQGQVPHEFRQYAKLIRRIGLGSGWTKVRENADQSNRYVMRWVRYFDGCAAEEASSGSQPRS